MKKIVQFTLILAVFAFIGMSSATAQKLGHVDAQLIVYEMPEMKQATSTLEALTGQYQKQLQSQEQQLRNKVAEATKKQERGELSPTQVQTIQAEFQQEEQKLVEKAQQYEKDLLKKEDELTSPLYEKIRTAIKNVAAENGYTYIIDASSLLYADETDNITSRVRAKLGM